MDKISQLQARQLMSAKCEGAAVLMTADKPLGEASLKELVRAGFLSGPHLGLTPKGEVLASRLVWANGKLSLKAAS